MSDVVHVPCRFARETFDRLFSLATGDVAPADSLEPQSRIIDEAARVLKAVAVHYERTGTVPEVGAAVVLPEKGDAPDNVFQDLASALSMCGACSERIVRNTRAGRPALAVSARRIRCASEGVCADGARVHPLQWCLEACRSGDAVVVDSMYSRMVDVRESVEALDECLRELHDRRCADEAGAVPRREGARMGRAQSLAASLRSLCLALEFARRDAGMALDRVRAANHGRLP